MRILIIALLVLNILYFIGIYLFNLVFDQAPSFRESNIPTITLLSMNAMGDVTLRDQVEEETCYSIGPYSVEKTARLVANKISQEGLTVTIHNQQANLINQYIVFLPQLANQEEAKIVVADLVKHQINNASIIETGPYKNAIALGFFDDLDKARRHAEYVRYLGYDAKYTEQRQRTVIYWISYNEPFERKIMALELSKSVDPKAVVQRVPESCE